MIEIKQLRRASLFVTKDTNLTNLEKLAQEHTVDVELLKEEKLKKITKENELRAKRADYSDNYVKELSAKNLRKFYLRAVKELNEFWAFFWINKEITDEMNHAFNKSQEKINFEELCFLYRITFQEVMKYQKYLKWRVKEVE